MRWPTLPSTQWLQSDRKAFEQPLRRTGSSNGHQDQEVSSIISGLYRLTGRIPGYGRQASKRGAATQRSSRMEKLEEAAKLASELKIEHPYSLPGILLGTSAFTANGWQCSFYPAGMKRDSKRLKWIARFMAHLLPRRLRSGTRRRRILSSPRRSRES